MINKIWTILSGAPSEPVFGDWRRLTELQDIHISSDNAYKIKLILGDTDPNIRGYIVEGVLQAALKSSYAESLLEYDKNNTYANQIAIRRNDNVLYKEDNTPIACTITKTSDNPVTYRLNGSICLSGNTHLSITVNGNTKFIPLSTTVPLNSTTSINFVSTSAFSKDIVFDVYQLPTATPLTIFASRLEKYYPAYISNTPAYEAAGKFILDLIK